MRTKLGLMIRVAIQIAALCSLTIAVIVTLILPNNIDPRVGIFIVAIAFCATYLSIIETTRYETLLYEVGYTEDEVEAMCARAADEAVAGFRKTMREEQGDE